MNYVLTFALSNYVAVSKILSHVESGWRYEVAHKRSRSTEAYLHVAFVAYCLRLLHFI